MVMIQMKIGPALLQVRAAKFRALRRGGFAVYFD
jgi:hypothetical protein